MKGGDIVRLQKILGHKSLQMTMRYAHLAASAFADDIGRFGAVVTTEGSVITLPSAGVVEIRDA